MYLYVHILDQPVAATYGLAISLCKPIFIPGQRTGNASIHKIGWRTSLCVCDFLRVATYRVPWRRRSLVGPIGK